MGGQINTSTGGSSLAEILERVLDKGVVIAGDISIALADVELLTIRIRLVVASIDKAVEMGIDWWRTDPYLSSSAKKEQAAKEPEKLEQQNQQLEQQNRQLEERIESLENQISKIKPAAKQYPGR